MCTQTHAHEHEIGDDCDHMTGPANCMHTHWSSIVQYVLDCLRCQRVV